MFQEEDLAELQSNADAIDKFQTYEDYLDDQISAEDMFYLEVSPSLGGRWKALLIALTVFHRTRTRVASPSPLLTPHTPRPTPHTYTHSLFASPFFSRAHAHAPTRTHAHTAHTHTRSLEPRTRTWPGSSSRWATAAAARR